MTDLPMEVAMADPLEPTTCGASIAASRSRPATTLPRRASGFAAVLLVLMGAPVAAQPRPAEVRGHVGTATFFESARHVTAGASYRKYFGVRGWAIEPEYSFMTAGSHQDHMLILNVVKDFTSPSRRVVPYMVMGAGINFYRTPWSSRAALGGLGWGIGFKTWTGRRVFIAPEFRIGAEPNLRFSISLGFAPRR